MRGSACMPNIVNQLRTLTPGGDAVEDATNLRRLEEDIADFVPFLSDDKGAVTVPTPNPEADEFLFSLLRRGTAAEAQRIVERYATGAQAVERLRKRFAFNSKTDLRLQLHDMSYVSFGTPDLYLAAFERNIAALEEMGDNFADKDRMVYFLEGLKGPKGGDMAEAHRQLAMESVRAGTMYNVFVDVFTTYCRAADVGRGGSRARPLQAAAQAANQGGGGAVPATGRTTLNYASNPEWPPIPFCVKCHSLYHTDRTCPAVITGVMPCAICRFPTHGVDNCPLKTPGWQPGDVLSIRELCKPRAILRASSHDDDLRQFWAELNTYDDDVVVEPPKKQPSRPRLGRPENEDWFTVDYGPRISLCSPGGDDFFAADADPAERRPPPPPPPPRPTTHYDVLEVSPDASAATIRKAFQALAKRHHPDKGGDRQAFETVFRAWKALSSPARKRAYDDAVTWRQTSPRGGAICVTGFIWYSYKRCPECKCVAPVQGETPVEEQPYDEDDDVEEEPSEEASIRFYPSDADSYESTWAEGVFDFFDEHGHKVLAVGFVLVLVAVFVPLVVLQALQSAAESPGRGQAAEKPQPPTKAQDAITANKEVSKKED
ncbi:hypothetical protein CTAYLR_001534 [Chrysophaeum taylorii]|uniref:J domain-containing protein n=1 Tax=Chrysophaeum taylorii TaxID=2483200 RepID=A0AAD7UFU9_9STRA|nr:hypothetical protein CTAYLR_001534 [Chrysophaeum taylorii]